MEMKESIDITTSRKREAVKIKKKTTIEVNGMKTSSMALVKWSMSAREPITVTGKITLETARES